ncbi:MAG: AsmA family protein, partial [Burkholderiaceae bacterium]|nr:AsmA family protein [Burkholderiaceae bacterium]
MKSPLLRNLLFAFGALLLALAGVLTWLVSTFDAERAKALAIDWMQQHHERALVIGGPLELSVFPRLELQVSDVRLSEQRSAAEFFALDEASLSVALWPLLSKTLVVDRISARGLRLNYTRDAKGVSNIDDLLAADAKPEQTSDGTELRLDVSKVEFEDLHANVRDALGGVQGEIVVDSLSSGRLSDKTEAPLALKASVTLQEPALRGNLNGETLLAFDAPGRTVRLRDMALSYQGEALGVKALAATLRGALAYNGTQGNVQAEDLSLQLDATIGKLKLVDSNLHVQRFGFDPEQRNLSLEKLVLRLQGSSAGSPVKLALDWPQLAVNGNALQGSALKGSVSLAGETGLSGNFESAAPRGDFELITIPGFQANFKGASGARKLSGNFKSELHLKTSEPSLAFNNMHLAAQWQEPGLQALKLALEGTATLSAQKSRWVLNGQLSGSDFNTNGSVTLSGNT